MSHAEDAHQFFETYAGAVRRRDSRAVAEMYAVPSLILFPHQQLPVDDTGQVEHFLAEAWEDQAETEGPRQVEVLAEAPHSVWVDVRWTDEGSGGRYVYQLVETRGEWRIAVLTPMA